LESGLDELVVNGSIEHRLPHNLNMSFAHVEAEALMMGVPGVALSSGSACTSATMEPSYVLRAMGIDDVAARTAIRFGLGRFNTEEEVDCAAVSVIAAVGKLRELAQTYDSSN
jgi:cysteine desulfurase